MVDLGAAQCPGNCLSDQPVPAGWRRPIAVAGIGLISRYWLLAGNWGCGNGCCIARVMSEVFLPELVDADQFITAYTACDFSTQRYSEQESHTENGPHTPMSDK